MAYSIHIFCKKTITISVESLCAFFEDHVFFDEDPKVIHQENTFEIYYEKGKSPIRISLHKAYDDYFENEIYQIKDILNISRDSKGKKQLSELINGTTNLLLISINREEFESDDDDVWEFLDVFEAHTATEFDGFIHTNDEIFYDKNLKKFYKL